MNDVKRLYTLIFCFAAVYVIWGSTYMAIAVGVQSIPPWTLTSIRFLTAGILLYFLSRLRKDFKLNPTEFRVAVISGLLMTTANGIVCVAEQWVPSGIAALIIGAMPIWMMMIAWIGFKAGRPGLLKFLGAGLGLIGVGIIASRNFALDLGGYATAGVFLLLTSSCLWSVGTLIQKGVMGPGKLFRFSAVQNFWGSMLPILLCLIFEKPWSQSLDNVTAESTMALVYLIVFGSILAFTAYSWLARNVEAHILSTYALVNPLIAILLGALVLGEALDSKLAWATLFVLSGLALMLKKPKAKVSEG